MIGDVYIKLGSGKAKKHNAGNKGALLDQAARAGIRVPRGVLLLDTAWDQAVLSGVMTFDADGISVPRPARLMKFLDLPDFNRPLAFRSAFSAEDADDQSLAGYFETVLDVPPDDPNAQANALRHVLESSGRYEGRFRRDVLVMEMVKARHAGVAFTEREHEDDLVNYTEGTAQSLMSGAVQGKSIPLAKLRNYESRLRGEHLEPWQRRLQKLLKQVRRWLGNYDWDVEWADDGEYCYLVQVRPVTRPTRRNEAFTIANHKEILPELPSVFMTSIVESAADDLFDYYRQFDPSLPSTRPFIEVFYGRPYINLSLMSEMMRIFGLPTRLVTDNIGGETDRVYGLNPGRVLRKIMRWRLPRFAFAQLNSVRHVDQMTETLQARTADPGDSFTEIVETLRWSYITLVQEMFSLTAAIGPMLSVLRNLGVLEEHHARLNTVSSQIYTDLEPLRAIVARHAEMIPSLKAGDIPDDPQFRMVWDEYLARYGHRGIYESDIAQPRYAENPAPLLRSLVRPAAKRALLPGRSLLGLLTLPLWWQARRTIRAREQWRHDVIRAFQRTRQALLNRAEDYHAQGLLPSADAIWRLTVEEVKSLEGGWRPRRDFWAERDAEIAHMARYHLPDLLRRFDDLEIYHEDAGVLEIRTRLSGISLTTGELTGRAWVLNQPDTELPDDFDPDETILVARSVDAGWIPTFSLAAGVVVETGGDLSHGSVILREIGLPAVTNISKATRYIHTGDTIYLDASTGVVEILESLALADADAEEPIVEESSVSSEAGEPEEDFSEPA
ncbi:MAG: PEP-utilizing enzyme [Chloroflexota bacterium]